MDNFLKNKKVKIKFRENIEPQEIFLDRLSQKKENELGFSETRFEVLLPRNILIGLDIAFFLLVSVFFAKTFNFQILQNSDFQALADENRQRIVFERPERGIIYDSSMKKLVLNMPSFDLVADKRDLPKNEQDKKNVVAKISEILIRSQSEEGNTSNSALTTKKIELPNSEQINKLISESQSYNVLILENIPHQTLVLLESKISELPGFRIEKNITRNYLDSQLFSHVIGYTGLINEQESEQLDSYSINDYVGKTGLEKSYETYLRGNPGKTEVEKDSMGNTLSEKTVSDPETGKSLVLWLDSELQKKLETSLEESVKRVGSKKGAAVAIDPKTGGVLALVSYPGFDNNLFTGAGSKEDLAQLFNNPDNPLFNRVTSGGYQTGSTIKPLIASAALQEKIISPDRQIYDIGFIEVASENDPKIIYTYKDWMPHGLVDIRKAIAVSCNDFFYTVGGGYKDIKGLGVDRIKKYLNLFGWGYKTGIDLPDDQAGLIPDAEWKQENIGEPWYTGNTYHLSIGQEFLKVSPLQVVMAYTAIANGGKLLEPHLVQKITNTDGSTYKTVEPKVIRENFIDPANLKIVKEGMREGVTYGSSVTLNDLPIKAAAKTGTAQTQNLTVSHSWISVFAPYDDPQIVMTIVVEDVNEGNVAVLPVAKDVLSWYFSGQK